MYDLFTREMLAPTRMSKNWRYDTLLPGSRHWSVAERHACMVRMYDELMGLAGRIAQCPKRLSPRDAALWVRMLGHVDVTGHGTYSDLMRERSSWYEVTLALPVAPRGDSLAYLQRRQRLGLVEDPGIHGPFGQESFPPEGFVHLVVRRTQAGGYKSRHAHLRFNLCLLSSVRSPCGPDGDEIIENLDIITDKVLPLLGLDPYLHTVPFLSLCEYIVTASMSMTTPVLRLSHDLSSSPPPISSILAPISSGGLSVVSQSSSLFLSSSSLHPHPPWWEKAISS